MPAHAPHAGDDLYGERDEIMQTIHDSRHALATLDDAGIGTLQLRDAGKLNIVGTPAIGELRAALHTLAATPALRVLVLRGHSEHAFIGGADIGEMSGLDVEGARSFITRVHRCCEAVHHFPTPVIARINGVVLGAGLELAAACDLRVAVDTARFGMPEVHLGIPSVVEAALLPHLMGWGRAREILLLGETFDAAQAEQWGVIERAVPADQLDATVAGLALLGLVAVDRLVRTEALRVEPGPVDAVIDQVAQHAVDAAEAREDVEDEPDGVADPLVGVQRHLARRAPEIAARQVEPELASFGLVPTPLLEPGTHDVKLGLAHRALQAQQQPIVEVRRIVHAVFVADQRKGQFILGGEFFVTRQAVF